MTFSRRRIVFLTAFLTLTALGWFLVSVLPISRKGEQVSEFSPTREKQGRNFNDAQRPLQPTTSPSEQSEPDERLLTHTNWPGAKVLVHQEQLLEGDQVFSRAMVVQPVDLPYPVLIEEKLIRDTLTSTERVTSRREMVANHLLFKIAPERDPHDLAAVADGLGAAIRPHPTGRNLYFLDLPGIDSSGLQAALEKLRKLPILVAFAEPDFIVHAFATPNDARFGEQWGLDNTGQSGGTADSDMDAPEGWDVRNDASGVIVGVIDTGTLYTHEDLQANMWENPNEIPGNGNDDDNNGYIDDIFGINSIITGSGDPLDDDLDGHGTHTSGTIGARGNNNVGVAGVAWSVQIMALKFLSSQGSGTVSDAIECIDYGIAKGANILSNSWGGGGFSLALDDAIERAQTAGIIFVAAAGNDAGNNDAIPAYPASYIRDNVVSVASMTRTDALSSFSNFGESSVDIAAPGSSILSVGSNSNTAYKTLSGTSMACPHVSGVMAVLMAQFPGENYLELIDRLYGGAESVSAYQGKTRTGRRANLAGSLLLPAVIPYPKIVAGIGNPIVTTGTSVTLTVQATGGGTLSYKWLKDGILILNEQNSSLVIGSATQSEAGQYQVLVSNAVGETTSTGDLEIGITNPAFNAAVDDGGLPFFTSGDANWIVDNGQGHSDNDSVTSGSIGNEEQSRLQSSINGPGTISFWWKVSSESNFDFLQFFVGGQLVDQIAGEKNWAEIVVEVPTGTQTLEWIYFKDQSVSDGEDRGWVDDVEFVSANIEEPFIFNHPVSVSLVEGEPVNLLVESFGAATLEFQWEKDQVAIEGERAATLFIASATKSDAGRYRAVVTNGFGSATSDEAVVDVFGDDPIGEALDFPGQTWNEAGNAFWFPQSITQQDGVDALQSGNLDDEEFSAFSFDITGPVDLAFQWKSSTETYFDFLTVELDSVVQAAIAGKRDWHQQLLRLPAGSHNVRWVYQKDPFVFEGEDTVWVDELKIVDVDAMYNEAIESENNNLVWSMEETSWFVQSAITKDGQDALQSGPTTRDGHSAIQTTVTGPATVSFWWKVSSQTGGDFLKFFLEDTTLELLLTINGEQNWSQRIVFLDAGDHTLKWSYEKNFTTNTGQDAGWLDQLEIVYTPSTVEDWRILHFSSTDLADSGKESILWGDLANPDGDFLPNLAEAFMGLDPNVRDLEDDGNFAISADADFLRLVYRKMKSTPGLTGVVEWSADGSTWSTTGVDDTAIEDFPAVEVREAKIPIGTNTKLFARLRVSR